MGDIDLILKYLHISLDDEFYSEKVIFFEENVITTESSQITIAFGKDINMQPDSCNGNVYYKVSSLDKKVCGLCIHFDNGYLFVYADDVGLVFYKNKRLCKFEIRDIITTPFQTFPHPPELPCNMLKIPISR